LAETYWTFHAFMGMLPGTSGSVTCSQASSVPGGPDTEDGGV